MAIGVPPETIVNDVREGYGKRDQRDANFPIKKSHFISKKQIKEIARKMNIDKRLHPDDAMSTYLIVQSLVKEKYNSVLLYKPQNEKTVIGPALPADDLFLLGTMTKQQEVMLKKNSDKIICLDSTHSTNQYKFKLITLLVPEEFCKGYPVAHLISN